MSVSAFYSFRRDAIKAGRLCLFWPALLSSLFGVSLTSGISLAQSASKPAVVPNPVRPATPRGPTLVEAAASVDATAAGPSSVASTPATNRTLFQNSSLWAADSITATLGDLVSNTVPLSSAQPNAVIVQIKALSHDRIPFDDGWRPFLTDLSGLDGPAEITFENPIFLGRLSTTDTCWQFTAKAKSTPPEGGVIRLLLVELKRDDRLFAFP